ncbi:MAG: tRNA (guanosine(37)-N1)-methyltransferase TrmD [Candidatus Pacebacteria bacterium]|nr:tRNA (guanosine(37)-N1)-methyltransferase TrmD [Candidatus Paceibacterota bacterium]
MKFDIITIFPNIFDSYFNHGLIARGLKKKLIQIKTHNLRKWTIDKHKSVDDRPFGGGLGMVMKIEPIFEAVKAIKKNNSKVIFFTPRGKKFNQKIAWQLSKQKQLIFICGRYEGVDERVAEKIADLKLSIGDYVLMGGEVPTLVVIEAVSRLIPGIIAKEQLLQERTTKKKGYVEYPQYTRPEVFNPKKGVNWKVPKELISGNHERIRKWREKKSQTIEK